MQVSCFALEPGGGLRPEDEAAAMARWRAGAGPYWVDLRGGEPEVVMGWLAGLDLDASLLDQMRLDDDETKFLPRQQRICGRCWRSTPRISLHSFRPNNYAP